ncbi:hypothetical protein TARUN_9986 [Trichoderma arundinaceum]|uniref:Uncharacterized protein n=1 Tax=Trichoderma arundinaceum TaxID=490622 RepID=A0A395N8E2_TRIAR|nr:hypothetical protein TARUN_9986 [Trichoderma arundinaceum]
MIQCASIFRLFLYALAISLPVTAFRIPDRLADGVYEISAGPYNRGKPFMVAQYDMDMYRDVNITAKHSDERTSPPDMSLHCPKPAAADVDAAGIEAARLMLGIWCDFYSPKRKTIVMAVRGNTSWYLCGYRRPPGLSKGKQRCSREEIDMAAERIDGWCGKGNSGSVDIEGWGITYGRTRKDLPICPRVRLRGSDLDRALSGISSAPNSEGQEGKEKDGEEELV